MLLKQYSLFIFAAVTKFDNLMYVYNNAQISNILNKHVPYPVVRSYSQCIIYHICTYVYAIALEFKLSGEIVSFVDKTIHLIKS